MAVTLLLVIIVSYKTCRDSLRTQQSDLMLSWLNADMLHLYDCLGDGPWSIENGHLKKGAADFGDGTDETANIQPFLDFEAETGTFCYVFKVDDERELQSIKGDETHEAYDEGHFLRVAGSTKDPDGKV